MADNEYEILPHEELQKLREEVEELKKNPLGNIQESEDLKGAMGKLTRAMHHLIEILTRTNDEMVSEFKRTTMSEHFQKISDQNEKIATALLGLAQLQEQPSEPPSNNPMEDSMNMGTDMNHSENMPGMMHTQSPQPTSADTPFPQHAQAPHEMPMHAPDQHQQDNTMPGLDIPPPEHHRKKLTDLFKK